MRARVAALMIAAGTAGGALGVATPAAAQQDFYVCTEMTGETCTNFEAVLDGLASFEQLGVSGEGVGYAVGFGMGVYLALFAVGLALGSIHRVFAQTLGGSNEG